MTGDTGGTDAFADENSPDDTGGTSSEPYRWSPQWKLIGDINLTGWKVSLAACEKAIYGHQGWKRMMKKARLT